MSDDEDDVCLHKGVRVPNGPYLTVCFRSSWLELVIKAQRGQLPASRHRN